MKRQFLCLLLAMFASVSLFSQALTSTAPNGVFTKNDISYWVGSGTNEAALVIIFNDGRSPNAVVWGYRWNGTKTMWQMLGDIANEDPRFFYMGDGNTLGGFGVDVNEDGQFSLHYDDDPTSIITPTNGLLVGSGQYDYDDWVPTDPADRWVSSWSTAFWMLSNGGISSQITSNTWLGATFTTWSGGAVNEDLTNATYTSMLPPSLPSDPCISPTNLASSQIETLQATISFSDNSIDWTLDYKTQSEQSWTSIAINTNPYTITQLFPQTTYNIRIRSLCSASDTSDYSDTLTFTTLSLPCNVPQALSAENITTSSVSIDWTSENSLSWLIDYQAENTGNWNTVASTIKPYQMSELFPQTTYNIRIRSLCSASDTSEYSDTLTFTTMSLPCNKPDGLAITNITDSSAFLTWDNSQAIEWELCLDTIIPPTTLNDTSYIFQNLTHSTQYTAYVRAKCNQETYSEWSSINFTTLNQTSLSDIYNQTLSVKIYPNPATIQTKLIVSGVNGETKIILSDVQGRVLNTINAKPVSGTIEQTIELNNLAKGIYYIRIQNSETSKTQKLIVK